MRCVLVAPVAVAFALVLAGPAQADTFCVDINDVNVCNADHNGDVQGALDAAKNHAGEDTVRIGPNTYSGGPYTYTSGPKVNIIGAGTGQTELTIGAPAAMTIEVVLRVSGGVGSTVSDLTVDVPDDGDTFVDRGLQLGNNQIADGFEVTTSADQVQGIFDRGTYRNGTVDLGIGIGSANTGVSGSAGYLLEDMTIKADVGINSAAMTVKRTSIRATTGIRTSSSGQVDVDNSIIDLGSDNNNQGAEVPERFHLPDRDGAAANNQTLSVVQIDIYRIMGHISHNELDATERSRTTTAENYYV